MDDTLKLQKLAAARNKLKSHQQKKQKKPESTASSNEAIATSSDVVEKENENQFQPQIQSYFGAPPTTATFFDSVSISPFPIATTATTIIPEEAGEPDAVTIEDPEINPNEVFEYANQQHTTTNENISTTEQLRQLSNQITNLVDTNGYENYSNYSDLEKRNLELANGYEKEKVQSEQLHSDLTESKSRVSYLERQLELLRVECENRIRHELGPLENEVMTHRQTFGILVGEKTELSASLNHAQLLLKQKTTECEELQARLKTSRSRVADLEKETTGLKDEKGRHAQVQSGHNQEFERLQQELQDLHAHKSETEQDMSEMRERLKKLQEENSQLAHSSNEYEQKLAMATIKIQQLTTGLDPSASERSMQEKLGLERQVLDLNSSLKTALAERDQACVQYQQYVQQLNGNISGLAEKLEASSAANETALKREQELVQHIGDLEKRLQNLQQETVNNIYKQQQQQQVSNEPNEPAHDVDALKQKLQDLETHSADLQVKFESIKAERDEFIKDVENKKLHIEDLESLIERLKGNQGSSTQLLAEIESEKVAASRAVDQNIKLKQQLEEMQEAFIRMTNDKAEVLTQLSSAEFRYKEIEDLQLQTSQQLHTLSEAIVIKDRELTDMRTRTEALSRETVQQDQLNDRLRHYEAHENSVHALTHELQKAREEIQVLMGKNKQLETKLLLNVKANNDELDERVKEPEVISQAVQTVHETCPNKMPEAAVEEELTPREIAIRQLESKFMRTMQEIANLQDEKQMLEHIVLQLQGETETIGEYIALYQHQRGVLKQRAIEKETQLKQLSRDREHMKVQLQMLNDLIQRLLSENKITDGVLQEQQKINQSASSLCEQHAQMHKEITDGAEVDGHQQQTAQQIMALLGEIKTSNLVQPTDVSDTFHPCPLCSGQLITV